MDYFTFSLAYKEYKCFKKRSSAHINISKDTFIKIFIDLICKGFFKSKSTNDFISVNNKVVLGIEENDLHGMIKENLKGDNHSTGMTTFLENRSA
jgi:hypothetical protein